MESDYEEFEEMIEYMNTKQKVQLATLKRKQKLITQEDLRQKLFWEVVVLGDRISAEETELFEKRVEMEEAGHKPRSGLEL